MSFATKAAILALFAVASATGVTACAAQAPLDDAHTDNPRDIPQSPARTYDFVVRTLTVDDRYDVGVAHTGLNLDGLYSGPLDADGCNHEDFFSLSDRDQHRPAGCVPSVAAGTLINSPSCAGGVDNQWLQVFDEIQSASPSGDIHAEILEQITRGQHTYLIRISDVNDLTNDPTVRVRLWEGYPESVDCDSMFSGAAEFSVASWSLRPGGIDIDADARLNQPGRIEAGRLIMTRGSGGESVHLPLPSYWRSYRDPHGYVLHGVQLRLTLSRDGASASDGVIAGWFDGDEIISPSVLDQGFRRFVESLVARTVDIHLPGSVVCVDRSTPSVPQFGGISAGVGFTAVRAVIRAQPASDRRPGTCGSNVADRDGGG